MDDLSGLSWAANTASDKRPPMSTTSHYPSLRVTPPTSGRSTPFSAAPQNGPLKPSLGVSTRTSTPTNDSFSNLVSFSSATSTKTLSLQEQQKRLEEQKAKQEDERKKAFDAHFGNPESHLRQNNGTGKGTFDHTLNSTTSSRAEGYGTQKLSSAINKPFASIAAQPHSKPADNDEDLLAAFDSTAPVDTASNFPVPPDPSNGHRTSSASQHLSVTKPTHHSALLDLAGHDASRKQVADDEDDPFGLGRMNHTSARLAPIHADGVDEDDVLGLLGKPVSELPPHTSVERQTWHEDGTSVVHSRNDKHPQDQALAELVEMGFPAEKAREALSKTDTGVDIQAAVGSLLSQAHQESRQNHRGRGSPDGTRRRSRDRNATTNGHKTAETGHLRADAQMPAWMRKERHSNSTQRRQDSRSPANGEKDATQYAAEISSNLFRSANSLWKTGIKKIEQTVGELNSDSDSSQPKWMRAHAEGGTRRQKVSTPSIPAERDSDRSGKLGPEDSSQRRPSSGLQQTSITDEALMLESTRSRPPQKTATRSMQPDSRLPTSSSSSRDPSPALPLGSTNQRSSQPIFLQRQHLHDVPKAKLSRELIDEQSSVAYVSPARRKRPPPKPADSEPNLLGDSHPSTQISRPSTTAPTLQPKPSQPQALPSKSPLPSTNVSARPKPPPRKIPQVSISALSSSASHRQKGTEAFKLGDYAAAHAAYTSALAPMPDEHPITIIILCNRALTNLKIGEPKAAVSDADNALSLIGPSHGEGEIIALGPHEAPKEMRDFYGKALMRKAEALEQMERWSDAARVWREAVESGHGGSTSIQGRDRSEKAAGRSSHTAAPAVRTRPPPSAKRTPPPKKQSALNALSSPPAPSAEAVTRLRAANAAAERADDEKFALADSVDARLAAWRNGKQDNLRALLGSLDTVLWPEAGWKKVGLHELVLAGKVKVVYMRGIAKVHPDKVRSVTLPLLFGFRGWMVGRGCEGVGGWRERCSWNVDCESRADGRRAVTAYRDDRAEDDQWGRVQYFE